MGMWKKHIGVLTPLILLGSHILNYDSMIVLTHFKGHAMGGFGGSLKNIAIGNASGQLGKRQVHGYLEGPMPPAGDAWGKCHCRTPSWNAWPIRVKRPSIISASISHT